jgi:hypothetical protein
MSEHKLQNVIRNALVGEAMTFRANVGQAWTGDATRMADGSVLLRNPRPFSTGLPAGFSDLFGLVPVIVTPDMIDARIGVFVALEIKTATGRVSDKQAAFLRAVNDNGGRAGVARSPADALAIIKGKL